MLDGIHDKVRQLNESILPKGMQIRPFYDRTDLVGETLGTVHHNLLFGALLVMAIVWLFLRSIRCSLIVASIIPLALLTAFIGLQLIHLPANLISMGAVDFGILVDGAVVLVENVLHEAHRQKPKRRRELLQLIIHSAVDVARPTFFAMAIIIAALIPVFTLQRVEGRIFRPLALTYSFALLGALVFALTVIPALCAVVLRPRDAEVREPTLLVRMRDGYERLVAWLFGRRAHRAGRRRGVCCSRRGSSASRLGSEFLPELDEGDIVIFVEMPPSIALDRGGQDPRRRSGSGCWRSPRCSSTLSEQGRPEDGTDDEGVNMSETFVHVAPRDKWRPGMDEGSPQRGDARVADRDSRRQLQFLGADQGQRRGSRQRRPRTGGAEDLRHRSRRHEEHARAVRRRRSARCRASSTSGSIAMRACRSCRSCSTADRWRAPAST